MACMSACGRECGEKCKGRSDGPIGWPVGGGGGGGGGGTVMPVRALHRGALRVLLLLALIRIAEE